MTNIANVDKRRHCTFSAVPSQSHQLIWELFTHLDRNSKSTFQCTRANALLSGRKW